MAKSLAFQWNEENGELVLLDQMKLPKEIVYNLYREEK